MSIPTTPRHARPRRRRGRLAVLLVALLLLPSAVVTALEGRDLDEVIDVDTDNISVGTPVLDLTAATRPNLTITVPVENTASATAVTVAMFPTISACGAGSPVAAGAEAGIVCTRPAPSRSNLDDDDRLPIVLRLSADGEDPVTLNEDGDDADLRTPVLTILDGSIQAAAPGTTPIVTDEPYRVTMTVSNRSTVAFTELVGARLGTLAATSCRFVSPEGATTVPVGEGDTAGTATVACDWNGGPSLRDQTTLTLDVRVTARTEPVRLSTTIDLSDVPLGTDGDDGDDQPVVTEPGDDGDLNEDLDLPGIDDPDVAAPEAGADVGDATALPVTGMQLLGLLLTLGLAAALIGWWMTRYTDERDGFVRVQ